MVSITQKYANDEGEQAEFFLFESDVSHESLLFYLFKCLVV